jgi:hypothetical protein
MTGSYIYHRWGRLHSNNSYECKQRQINTKVSPFVYCAEVFLYMLRPSRGHHQAYLTRIHSYDSLMWIYIITVCFILIVNTTLLLNISNKYTLILL